MGERIDYEYFRNIPIEEVANELGIEVTKQHKFLCPCHNDHSPSAIIQDSTNPKFPNTWKCWACGEGGSPIDLVLAEKYHILPSEAKAPGRYTSEKRKAVEFLHQYFGGGIIHTSKKEDEKYPPKPSVPAKVLRACGLKQNPLHNIAYTNNQSDAADILLTALMNREDEIWNYTKSVLTNFPRLGATSSSYIMEEGKKWVGEIHTYVEAVRDYYEAVMEIEFPDEDLSTELEN